MYKKSQPLITKDFILSHLTEEDIFDKYLGTPDIQLKKPYCNPLRKDDDAGCNYYRGSNGTLYFKDYSMGFHWDCFNVVEYAYNISFKETLNLIASDFNLVENINFEGGRAKKPRKVVEREVKYTVDLKEFTKKELDYWNQFYITKEMLKQFHVYSVSKAYQHTEGEPVKLIYDNYYNKDNPCFAYYLGKEEWKLYIPFNPKPYPRFRHARKNTLQGYYLLPEEGERLLITKSYKDVIAISRFNIPAVAPQAENIIMQTLDFTDLYNRFDNIYCLYDRDNAGKKGLIQMKKKYEPINALLFKPSEEKDISDNIKKYGIDWMQDKVNEVINYYEK